MVTNRTKEQLWHTTKSGVVAPVGISATLTVSSTQTYLHIKEKAKAIEKLYHDNSVPLPPDCALATLVSDAKTLSDAWLMDNGEVATWQLIFRVSFLDRIADAILPLFDVPERVKYLTILTSGNLNLQQRERSLAKDILWELELWSRLRRRGILATLHEPDIIVNFEDSTVGIACKKLYSENNVAKVLSEAVEQIEATHDFGILAVNLDDLTLPDRILDQPTQEAMGKAIDQFNLRFLGRHQRHFKRYLKSGRVISALVSTTVLATLSSHKPAFQIGTQATIWAIPGLPPEKKKQLQRFYVQLMEQ
jgi:hypothetical protein